MGSKLIIEINIKSVKDNELQYLTASRRIGGHNSRTSDKFLQKNRDRLDKECKREKKLVLIEKYYV